MLGTALVATSCSSNKTGVSAGEAQALRADVMKLKGQWIFPILTLIEIIP